MRFLTLLFLSSLIASLLAANNLAAASLSVSENAHTIDIKDGDTVILSYRKADVPPPEGVDPIYSRSGFIHPVRSPSGSVVTGIHPDDHYHHLGLWHAWVKCKVNGQEVDFWNLRAKTGRVRYSKTLELIAETQGAGFVVEQEHIAYLGQEKKETLILKERFAIKAKRFEGAYEIDYETIQENVSPFALELPAYRYGGPIAYRAPHHWDKTNSDYLSSEGKTRIDGHTTRSRWIAMWGENGSGAGNDTLTILCHPGNHDFPQRMRVWPPTSNNGAIFFNYVPIQEFDWEIKPGQISNMRYRLVVHEGKPEINDLNRRWERYAN
jgi:hypothetical protein